MNFHDNLKNKNCKNRKIDFSFVSAHYTYLIKTGSKIKVVGVCISLVGKRPSISAHVNKPWALLGVTENFLRNILRKTLKYAIKIPRMFHAVTYKHHRPYTSFGHQKYSFLYIYLKKIVWSQSSLSCTLAYQNYCSHLIWTISYVVCSFYNKRWKWQGIVGRNRRM